MLTGLGSDFTSTSYEACALHGTLDSSQGDQLYLNKNICFPSLIYSYAFAVSRTNFNFGLLFYSIDSSFEAPG